MKTFYINTDIQDFVVSREKSFLVIDTPSFYLGDVEDYRFYFVNNQKEYVNISGSIVKVNLSAPRKGPASGTFDIIINTVSASIPYDASPSEIVELLNDQGVASEVHGTDGAFQIILDSTSSLGIDVAKLQPMCSGYVFNYSGSAWNTRIVPKPFGYLEGSSNIVSASSVIGFQGEFRLDTVEAVCAVGSKSTPALIEVGVGEKTVLQLPTTLVNEINNEALNNFSSSVLPTFLTEAVVDGKLDSDIYYAFSSSLHVENKLDTSIYNIDSASFNSGISNKLDASRYTIDSGSFNSRIDSKLNSSSFVAFSSSLGSASQRNIGITSGSVPILGNLGALPLNRGGTGGISAAAARLNLELSKNSPSGVQVYDFKLHDISNLTSDDGAGFLTYDGYSSVRVSRAYPMCIPVGNFIGGSIYYIQTGSAGQVLQFKGGWEFPEWTYPSLVSTTVSTLPANPVEGQMGYVTDASGSVAGAVVTGSGAQKRPVVYNGTNWITYY